MRIISRFHDYYDALQAHGADDQLLMLRETVEHTDKEPAWAPLLKHFEHCFSHRSYDHDRSYQGNRKWNALTVRTGIVLFVGKPHLYFHTERTLKDAPLGSPAETRFIYDLDEMNALVQEHGAKDIYERGRQPNRWSRGYRDKSWVLDVWEKAHAKDFGGFASAMEAPIIHVGGRGWATTYPKLADLQFYKVIEPWQAYQELSMFLGNIAAPDRVPVTIADKDRVQQHGFDMKYGFRTRPKE